MSNLQGSTDLQRKVKKIAIGSTCLHLFGFGSQILEQSVRHNNSEISEYPTVLSMLIESTIGVIASILLYFGAKTRNKWLLIPFMINMVLLQCFLVITLFCIGMIILSGHPIALYTMVIVIMVILINFVCWMLRNTKMLYDDIRKNGTLVAVSDLQPTSVNPEDTFEHHNHVISMINTTRARRGEDEHHHNHVLSMAEIRSRGGEDIETNGTNLQVNLPGPSLDNLNQDVDNPDARTELPPAYNETSANSSTNNDGPEFPPSYDEAMAMKKESININDSHA